MSAKNNSDLDKIVLESDTVPERFTRKNLHGFQVYDSHQEYYWEGREVVDGVEKKVLVRGTLQTESTGRSYATGQPEYNFYFLPRADLIEINKQQRPSLTKGKRVTIRFMYEQFYRLEDKKR